MRVVFPEHTDLLFIMVVLHLNAYIIIVQLRVKTFFISFVTMISFRMSVCLRMSYILCRDVFKINYLPFYTRKLIIGIFSKKAF